jgi:phosphatidylglycerophosphatase C
MSEPARTVAIFDFDGTLIKGDSLLAFFVAAAGRARTTLAFLVAGVQLVNHYVRNRNDPVLSDLKTFVKAQTLQRILSGRRLDELRPAIGKLQRWRKVNEAMREVLQYHAKQGHHIVIATGAPDIYLSSLLTDLPHDKILCTEMEIDKNGRLTGHMLGGNCTRIEKAKRVAAYLMEQDRFEDSWGYGNRPDDLPMLQLVKHPVIV